MCLRLRPRSHFCFCFYFAFHFQMIGFLLIGVGVYARAASVVTNLPIVGGILACGVILICISMLGLAGAVKHHQVMLFFVSFAQTQTQTKTIHGGQAHTHTQGHIHTHMGKCVEGCSHKCVLCVQSFPTTVEGQCMLMSVSLTTHFRCQGRYSERTHWGTGPCHRRGIGIGYNRRFSNLYFVLFSNPIFVLLGLSLYLPHKALV